jgi:predicted nucleic acid-binding protein
MEGTVIDTDVVSYLFRRDPRAQLYRPHLLGKLWVISFMTLAEVEWGMLQRNWGQARRNRMEEHLQRFTIVYADRDLCRLWAQATKSARRNGRPILVADAWIAATALRLGLPLVTHNPGDYAGVDGLTVLSELGS